MKYTRVLIVVALLIACNLPCAAAQQKKDTLTEKWSKDKKLVYLMETDEEIIYVFHGTVKKLDPPEAPPQYITRNEDTDGTLRFAGKPQIAIPEHEYTFWTSTLLKPNKRGLLPGIYKKAVSVTVKWEINCDKNTFKTAKIIYYNAKGNVVNSIDGASPAEEAAPDSVAIGVIRAVCSLNIQ